jgi:hypothetical protein
MSRPNTIAVLLFLGGLAAALACPGPQKVPAAHPRRERACGGEPESRQVAGRSPKKPPQKDTLFIPPVLRRAESRRGDLLELADTATRMPSAGVSPRHRTEGCVRFVIISRIGPLLVDVYTLVEGRPLPRLREDLIHKTVAEADTDFDGRSTWEEAAANPRFAAGRFHREIVQTRHGDRKAIEALQSDLDRERDQLLEYVEVRDLWNAVAPDFYLGRNDPFGLPVPDLLVSLDADRDGALSPKEISQSVGRILDRDVNQNEYLEPLEYGAASQRTLVDTAESRLSCVQLLDDDARLRMRIREVCYSKATTHAFRQPRALAWQPLRQAIVESIDFHPDGALELRDARRMHVGPAHLTLEVEFTRRASSEAARLRVREAISALAKHLHVDSSRAITLRLPGLTMELSAAGLSDEYNPDSEARRLMTERDLNRDGRLTRAEITPPLNSAFYRINEKVFATVDMNGDGKIELREALTYIERIQAPYESQLYFHVGEVAAPVLFALDANHDALLSLREILATPQRLREFDFDGDGIVQADEIPQRVAMGIGRGPYRPRSARHPSPRDLLLADWFKRMDRNGDGDLSRREFLGTPAQFAELDVDGDGLISSQESLAKKGAK